MSQQFVIVFCKIIRYIFLFLPKVFKNWKNKSNFLLCACNKLMGKLGICKECKMSCRIVTIYQFFRTRQCLSTGSLTLTKIERSILSIDLWNRKLESTKVFRFITLRSHNFVVWEFEKPILTRLCIHYFDHNFFFFHDPPIFPRLALFDRIFTYNLYSQDFYRGGISSLVFCI